MRGFLAASLAVGLGFLYLPIAVLVAFSFNRSALVSVWAGFSPRWYGALLRDGAVLHAARLSLEVASVSACLALVIGTLGGFALQRLVFRFRPLFAGLLAAPLVMPDVVIGISLLLLVTACEGALGWPHGRGVGTIVVGHATLTASFVAVVVQGRLAGADRSVEEAAADLGASPAVVFALVTVPLLVPALAAGWLLAFSLSLDDVVIASFLSGPGSTTLPVLVMSKIRLGVNPEINALATLFVLAVFLLVLAAYFLTRRRSTDPA